MITARRPHIIQHIRLRARVLAVLRASPFPIQSWQVAHRLRLFGPGVSIALETLRVQGRVRKAENWFGTGFEAAERQEVKS